MRVPMIKTDEGFGPDLPEGFRGRATLTEDGDYLLVPEGGQDERIEALQAQVNAAVSLAEKADATAQEVAQAMRDAAPGRP